MRYFILLLIIAILGGKNAYAQNISLGNNDVAVDIKYATGSMDTVLIVIRNESKKALLIAVMDEINASDKYIGIGLYSSVFPYTPDHMSKYSGMLKFTAINPTDSLVFRQKTKIKLFERLDFSLDYMLLDLKIETKEYITVERSSYDKCICFLRLKNNK